MIEASPRPVLFLDSRLRGNDRGCYYQCYNISCKITFITLSGSSLKVEPFP
jgi:hypothetical protein